MNENLQSKFFRYIKCVQHLLCSANYNLHGQVQEVWFHYRSWKGGTGNQAPGNFSIKLEISKQDITTYPPFCPLLHSLSSVWRKMLQNGCILSSSGSSNVLKRSLLQAVLAEFLASEKSQIPDLLLGLHPGEWVHMNLLAMVVIKIFLNLLYSLQSIIYILNVKCCYTYTALQSNWSQQHHIHFNGWI